MQATKETPTTQVVSWADELAKMALSAANAELSTSEPQFFSTRGGQLLWRDTPLPGNQMAVIILDTIFENVFYDSTYNADVIQPPACFAFSRSEVDLEPHTIIKDAKQAQSEGSCKECPNNLWGSANTGRGKACRNTRRLALLAAGTYDDKNNYTPIDDEDHFKNAPVGFLRLPVTSVRGYSTFVQQVAAVLRRPPYGIVARIAVVPDPKTTFKVIFEPMHEVNDGLMGAVMERHKAINESIMTPYHLGDPDLNTKSSKSGRKY